MGSYHDGNGNILSIIGRINGKYEIWLKEKNKRWNMRPFAEIPAEDDRESAQVALDKYAKDNGLQAVESEKKEAVRR